MDALHDERGGAPFEVPPPDSTTNGKEGDNPAAELDAPGAGLSVWEPRPSVFRHLPTNFIYTTGAVQ